MNLLLIREIQGALDVPPFRGEFADHIERKQNPDARRASLTAWCLLASEMRRQGWKDALPEVRFTPQGKPEFVDSPVRFSLSHSRGIAAALISDSLCGVDVEYIRPDVSERMRERCLSEAERAQNANFFDCWTKKECIGKLTGMGINAHPGNINTMDERWQSAFFSDRITDSAGGEYAIAALCLGDDPEEIVPLFWQ